MKRSTFVTVLAALLIVSQLQSQTTPPATGSPATTLHVTTRAVLVDVLVTDSKGNPVTGLKQGDFTVTDDGKPQTISFFEEHKMGLNAVPVNMPAMPPDVFTNFSPFPTPPAVNVLLLDSLNTPMRDQTYLHTQAMKFLKNLRPGSRMAIFTMSLGLHFVQGFTDDPAPLLAALGNGKSDEVSVPALLKSPEEGNAQTTLIGLMKEQMAAGGGATATAAIQSMIDALTDFFQRTDTAQTTDRAYRTLENLQELATFLSAFPGRKNLIWFSESFPMRLFGDSSQRFDDEIRKTVNLLTAARVAVYPVDARGVNSDQFFEADNTVTPEVRAPNQLVGPTGLQTTETLSEDLARDTDQETMSMLARDSGGKAFANTNGLSQVIAEVAASSADFYTISYSPTNSRMDGMIHRIRVKVGDRDYNLSYRRAYYASDDGLPGAVHSSHSTKKEGVPEPADSAVDPLLPFMKFGMPQTEEILYKVMIRPLAEEERTPEPSLKSDTGVNAWAGRRRYAVDFAVDLKDLHLRLEPDGNHKGTVYLALIVYNRYGDVTGHELHLVHLNIKPEVYALYQKAGLQIHGEIHVPKGQYWLRTGIYNEGTRTVGTMEVALSAVKPMEASIK